MKNNVLTLAIVAIAVLFTFALALYGASTVLMSDSGHNGQSSDNGTSGGLNDGQTGPDSASTEDVLVPVADNARSAFGSLSRASDDPSVRKWLADKNIVYVAGIASDFCSDGLSDQWTITYASDAGQYIACVVKGSIVDVHESQSTPLQGIDPRLAIDSDRAWKAVSGEIAASGGTAPENVAMKLIIVEGKPCWDISYQAPDGFRIVRVDAASGMIIDSVTIGP
jgi:hypothetical protein